jgi:hypothetical protein
MTGINERLNIVDHLHTLDRMYWPTSAARQIDCPEVGQKHGIQAVRPSKRGNFFVSFTKDTLAVWDVRVSSFVPIKGIELINQPTVIQAVAIRCEKSLERWGENLDVIWASDGRGLIVLVRPSFTEHSKLMSRQPHPTSSSFSFNQRLLPHMIIRPQPLSPKTEEQAKETNY